MFNILQALYVWTSWLADELTPHLPIRDADADYQAPELTVCNGPLQFLVLVDIEWREPPTLTSSETFSTFVGR